MKNVKVGTMPGRLVEVAVESTMTVREVFEIAGIEILNGYELKANGQTIDVEDKIGDNALVVQSKMIKGNGDKMVKVGIMPGRLVEIAIDSEETIKRAFEIAEITIPNGYELKANGQTVQETDKIGDNALIVASKMIKGNGERTVKVGLMPGRLVEILVEEDTTIKQAFNLAGIEIPNGYEVKANGANVELDDKIGNNALVVASKMIKGNSQSIKIGLMPGRLVEVLVDENTTVKEAFDLAGIEIPSGYEVKANGQTISLEELASGNALIVASKMIKGNK